MQSSIYFSNKEKIYLKREPDYNKRLEIVNDLLKEKPEEFDIDAKSKKKREINKKRLEMLSYYLIYDAYDENILSDRQLSLIKYKEFSMDFTS